MLKTVTGPALGLLYVVALPFIGIGMLVYLLAEKSADVLVKTAGFAWSPPIPTVCRCVMCRGYPFWTRDKPF